MKKILIAATALVALPVLANAQMPKPTEGFYIGAEGGLSSSAQALAR